MILNLLLMAFDKGEPWAIHGKYQVFEDKYTELFARPEVNADRIVLLRVIAESIDKALPVSDHLEMVVRKKIQSFKDDWQQVKPAKKNSRKKK